MRGFFVLALGIAVSASPKSNPKNPNHDKGWKPLAPIAGGPRQEHSVVALGDDVYILGGIERNQTGGFVTTDRVEVYNTEYNNWSSVAPLPVAMNHLNVATVDGKIYVVGGLSGGLSWRALRDAYTYDPEDDSWTNLPPMPAGTERGSSAVGVRGTDIFLAGGMRSLTPEVGGLQDTVDTVSSFSVTTGRWTTLSSMPGARDHSGGVIIDNTFYVVGGRDRGQANVRGNVYALDLNMNQWTEREPMPTPRGGIAVGVVKDKIYAFGGEGNPAEGSNSVFDDNEVYDVRRNRWQVLAPMDVPRHGTAAVAIGNRIYVPGGGNAAGGSPLPVNDVYCPA